MRHILGVVSNQAEAADASRAEEEATMARTVTNSLGLLVACILITGCTTNEYAHLLLERDTSPGKIRQAIMAPSEQLVKNGTISAARRYTMPDGTEIDVWIIKTGPTVETRGTVLALHGLGDSKADYRHLAGKLAEKGFDVVLPDLRRHGRSTGKHITYGALEKHDQQHVINSLLTEGIIREPLYVFGSNLGAAVAIEYGAADPRVKGIVAFGAFRDMRTLGRRFLHAFAPLMKDEDYQQVLARAGKLGKFSPNQASALEAIARVRCPILLLHSKFDLMVPQSDSEALFKAASEPKELELIPWGGRVLSEGKIIASIEKVASGRLGAATPPTDEQ